ncbi:toll/interleukin-1 receptor domain-containing protein [Leifsonia sp. PS1209]|uniref:toll/interleukin-1 receptor domain-containing protein n=1 Tax=Leifsonia sp. PS1209 TaxID=2724914 RepID=UPI001442C182|nr:toll/interleukin-1 receptor domain-containing protein [Leifsonia sp. PS1209]QIZ97833.1 toll/interleukin-1 receptor domain-containing protein [Leifsonia sp. PS1209]
MTDLRASSPDYHPRVFVSYASEPAIDTWVLQLCTRLMANGVDVIYDRWDVAAGDDLPHFMESGLRDSDRVLLISSDEYIRKANAGRNGAGYEKKIMTAAMMTDPISNRIVPVIRNAAVEPPVPTFLSGSRYVDFREDQAFESKYVELIHELYGRRIVSRPPLGPNPFAEASETLAAIQIGHDPLEYRTDALVGEIEFPYENNNGRFTIGTGAQQFTVATSGAGSGSAYFYSDPADIHSIAIAPETPLSEVGPIAAYDFSSRSRHARVGDAVILINTSGRVAALEVKRVTIRETSPDRVPRLSFKFVVLAEPE